jgi:hypothetical protein
MRKLEKKTFDSPQTAPMIRHALGHGAMTSILASGTMVLYLRSFYREDSFDIE